MRRVPTRVPELWFPIHGYSVGYYETLYLKALLNFDHVELRAHVPLHVVHLSHVNSQDGSLAEPVKQKFKTQNRFIKL